MMHSLLAFGFASPWLLWGLALGAAPILIHLLSRRKFRETQWAAMRFLMEAVRKNSRRLRMEQLLLLAVRTLLLVLLVLALAQPMVERLGAFFQPSQPVHRIIVIDGSLSMGLQSRDSSLFDRARDVARGIVESSRQGDAFNLARLSNLSPAVIVPNPAYQTSSVMEEIDQMQLPHGRGDAAGCLQKVEELLKLAPELPQKEIYLISDFQRATWTAETADEAARLKELLRKFGAAGELALIDLGQAEASNLAVTTLDALDSFVTTTRPARFRATVRNFGLERVTGRLLEFLVDDRVVEQRAIEIAAGAEAVESFSHAFSAGGEHRVQARLQRDALPLDDQRWLAVPVKERLRVLCVSGRPGNRPMAGATDFVELALSPAGESAGGGFRPMLSGQIEPVVVKEGELQGIDLGQYDCVILCDVRLFTDREARLIETYLRGGGGVVWCVGDNVRPENYNQTLYVDGKGILPARLEDRVGDAQRRDESFAFDPGDFSHPIVDPFQGNPDAGLETTQTYAYLRAVPAENGPAQVALRFDTGDPAIIEKNVGRGRSILITTSVDDRWGVWPLWPSFLPLMHEVVQFAVAGRWGERQRLVGEPLSGAFPAGSIDVEVLVKRPDGQVLPAFVSAPDAVNQFQFERTTVSGLYDVTFGRPLSRSEMYAVNVDPKESNLVKLSAEEIAQELVPGVEHEYSTTWRDQTDSPSETPVAERGGLTRWLLYAALYLLFVEQMLAWDFRKGLRLLCPLIVPFELAARARRS